MGEIAEADGSKVSHSLWVGDLWNKDKIGGIEVTEMACLTKSILSRSIDFVVNLLPKIVVEEALDTVRSWSLC